MWHRRGSSGRGGGKVGGDVDAASSCYDKSGGAAEGSVFSYGVVMVKYVCRGFTELLECPHPQSAGTTKSQRRVGTQKTHN